MAYQPSKPSSRISYQQGQVDVQGNFEQYKTAWDFDHYTFGNAQQGNHKKITLYPLDEAPTIGTSDIALYCRANTLNSQQGFRTLAIKRGSDGVISQFNFFAYQVEDDLTNAGWSLLPSGILIKWQSFEAINTNEGTFAFIFDRSPRQVQFTDIYAVFASPARNEGVDANVIINVDSWTVTSVAETVNLRLWRRNLPSTPGTDRGAFNVNVFAIGKGPVT
jgi:hypothetical protein